MNFYLFLFALLTSFRVSESRLVQAETAINQTCLKLASQHDCSFYSCFEKRFPCGSNYWIDKWGHKYCLRMKNSFSNFDKNGQNLIEQISNCLMDKLVKLRFYTLNNINCEQLRLAGQRIVHDCYVANSKLFCSAIEGKNRDCFGMLIDPEDQQDMSIIRTLSNVGQRCHPKKRLVDMKPNPATASQCLSTTTSWKERLKIDSKTVLSMIRWFLFEQYQILSEHDKIAIARTDTR